MINKNYSLFCRGILAIAVVLHHFLQLYNTADIPVLNLITLSGGYLSVSGFLFLSGYSTRLIFDNKKFNKPSHLLIRVLGVYIPFAICNSLYIIAMTVLADSVFWKEAILSYSLYILIVPSFWFIAFIIWNFLISFISFKFSNYKIVLFFGCVLFLIIALLRNLDYYWIYSSFSFFIGVVWFDFENKKMFAKINNYWFLIILSTFTLIFILIGQLSKNESAIQILPKMIAAIGIVLIIGLSSYKSTSFSHNKFMLFSKFIKYIGQMSLEIYLIHVMIIKIIAAIYKDLLPNMMFIVLLLFVGSFILAALLHKVDNYLFFKLKKHVFKGVN